MKKYVVKIDLPSGAIAAKDSSSSDLTGKSITEAYRMGRDKGETLAAFYQWPKYIDVPALPPSLSWNPPGPLDDPARKPIGINPSEQWMIDNVLPKHPNSVCTLMESTAEYKPATHVKS